MASGDIDYQEALCEWCEKFHPVSLQVVRTLGPGTTWRCDGCTSLALRLQDPARHSDIERVEVMASEERDDMEDERDDMAQEECDDVMERTQRLHLGDMTPAVVEMDTGQEGATGEAFGDGVGRKMKRTTEDHGVQGTDSIRQKQPKNEAAFTLYEPGLEPDRRAAVGKHAMRRGSASSSISTADSASTNVHHADFLLAERGTVSPTEWDTALLAAMGVFLSTEQQGDLTEQHDVVVISSKLWWVKEGSHVVEIPSAKRKLAVLSVCQFCAKCSSPLVFVPQDLELQPTRTKIRVRVPFGVIYCQTCTKNKQNPPKTAVCPCEGCAISFPWSATQKIASEQELKTHLHDHHAEFILAQMHLALQDAKALLGESRRSAERVRPGKATALAVNQKLRTLEMIADHTVDFYRACVDAAAETLRSSQPSLIAADRNLNAITLAVLFRKFEKAPQHYEHLALYARLKEFREASRTLMACTKILLKIPDLAKREQIKRLVRDRVRCQCNPFAFELLAAAEAHPPDAGHRHGPHGGGSRQGVS